MKILERFHKDKPIWVYVNKGEQKGGRQLTNAMASKYMLGRCFFPTNLKKPSNHSTLLLAIIFCSSSQQNLLMAPNFPMKTVGFEAGRGSDNCRSETKVMESKESKEEEEGELVLKANS